jgi:hypothetical protein
MTSAIHNDATHTFRTARDFLLAHRDDYAAAYAGFEWPNDPIASLTTTRVLGLDVVTVCC